jgi:hypothetical protein
MQISLARVTASKKTSGLAPPVAPKLSAAMIAAALAPEQPLRAIGLPAPAVPAIRRGLFVRTCKPRFIAFILEIAVATSQLTETREVPKSK